MKKKEEYLHIRIPKEEKENLKWLADLDDITISEAVRRLIRCQFIKKGGLEK